ncbi:glycosyltransferase family 4 protein [Aquabacter sp. CN5-332]|uniref:glycosyltransferase family 4 protein n=1 Tax=Aquabacter sp. CN5-332 TaxID=3156608 RepID=UPI0032B5531C
MIKALLAFPGALSTPTGGYAYDRQVLAHLPAHGVDAAPLPLPAGFPFPTDDAIEGAVKALVDSDPSSVLLVDGLALGAIPSDRLEPLSGRLVGLVHHPLALEEGLAESARARLFESEKSALSICSAVVVTSGPTALTLDAEYGVPALRLTVAEPGTEPVARAAADGDPPRLLAVGSVIPRKGYGILMEALAAVKEFPWTLTIVGSLDFDPTEASALRAAIVAAGLDARVKLTGALAADQLARAYEASDIFVHPSLYEGYGMVLAEALRRGLPLVCTTGGAADDTVPDGAGLKVPPGDAPALAAALRALLSDPIGRRRLADYAFEAGQLFPTWDETAGTIAEVLRAVAARQSAAR